MPEVLVIGAGISGLTAAWRLHSAGVEVAVLERSERPGGRMHSVELNDCVMEAGANFVTGAYRIVPGLARDVGITLRAVRDDSAIAIDGKLRAFRADRPASAMTAGILPVWSAIAQLPGIARFATRYGNRGTLDPLDWIDLDAIRADEWSLMMGLTALAERGWRPAYHGFYFQDTRATSAAAVAAMANHGLRQPHPDHARRTVKLGHTRIDSAKPCALTVRPTQLSRTTSTTTPDTPTICATFSG